MKAPWDWTEDDLLALVVDQVPESISLDYKACASLVAMGSEKDKEASKLSLSKDVSAFANSAGGTLVYGIIEDRKGGIPKELEKGFNPTEVSREWIEQVINSKIQRRIDGIRINRVALNKTAPGRVAYVVYVPQSTRAPHQAADKRFYKRFNFESVPMEEYEIRDVARRQESPALLVMFNFSDAEFFKQGESGARTVGLHLILLNEAEQPAANAMVELWVEERLPIVSAGSLRHSYNTILDYTREPDPAKTSSTSLLMRVFKASWSARLELPVFEGVSVGVTSSPIVFDVTKSGTGAFLLKWKVFSPLMTPRESFELLEVEEGGGFRISNTVRTEAEVFADPRLPWRARSVPTQIS